MTTGIKTWVTDIASQEVQNLDVQELQGVTTVGKQLLVTTQTQGTYNLQVQGNGDVTLLPQLTDVQQPDWSQTTGQQVILNKPVLQAVQTSGQYADLQGKPSLQTVQTSGSYTDLTNKPSIPASPVQPDWNVTDVQSLQYIRNKPSATQLQSDWTQTTGVTRILNKPTLQTVQTSGSYLDLTNKPTAYSLPTQASNVLGGVKVGSGLQISQGVLSVVPQEASWAQADWSQSSGSQQILNKPTLQTVQTSGSFNDLTDKPNLQVISYNQLTDKPTFATVQTTGLYSDISGKPTLQTVQTSGSYNDLTDKPGTGNYTLPTQSSNVLGGVKVGSGLSIVNGVLSQSYTSYSQGQGVTITNGVITNAWEPTTYTQGTGISITNGVIANTLASSGSSYTQGTGISITDGVIANTLPGTAYTQGTGISITDGVIANTVVNTTYTQGTGISITDGVISATGNGGQGSPVEGGQLFEDGFMMPSDSGTYPSIEFSSLTVSTSFNATVVFELDPQVNTYGTFGMLQLRRSDTGAILHSFQLQAQLDNYSTWNVFSLTYDVGSTSYILSYYKDGVKVSDTPVVDASGNHVQAMALFLGVGANSYLSRDDIRSTSLATYLDSTGNGSIRGVIRQVMTFGIAYDQVEMTPQKLTKLGNNKHVPATQVGSWFVDPVYGVAIAQSLVNWWRRDSMLTTYVPRLNGSAQIRPVWVDMKGFTHLYGPAYGSLQKVGPLAPQSQLVRTLTEQVPCTGTTTLQSGTGWKHFINSVEIGLSDTDGRRVLLDSPMELRVRHTETGVAHVSMALQTTTGVGTTKVASATGHFIGLQTGPVQAYDMSAIGFLVEQVFNNVV